MRNDFSSLALECLEERILLSNVSIIAAGSEGLERMQLEVDGAVVEEFYVNAGADIGIFSTYNYSTSQTLTADQISIRFDGDVYDPDRGVDRNLRVDAIILDGVRFETEAPTVFSDATWTSADGIQPGFGRGEFLHTDGAFQYAGGGGNNGSVITVNASGNTGDEQFDLLIEDQVVGSFDASTTQTGFQYLAAETVDIAQIRVRFTNDVYQPENGIDNNLIVDNVVLDGQVFETEAAGTFSTGTWTSADGIVSGYGRGDTLHIEGYFQYASGGNTGGTGSILSIVARGDTGDEEFAVYVDGVVVERLSVSGTSWNEFAIETAEPIEDDQVRIQFTNEFTDSTDYDRNVYVDYIEIDSTRYETEASNVYSTGTWLPGDAISPGFGRGEGLHYFGYFQFGAEAIAPDTLAADGSFGGANSLPAANSSTIGFFNGRQKIALNSNGQAVVALGDTVQLINADASMNTSFGDNGRAILSGLTKPIQQIEILDDGSILVLTERYETYPRGEMNPEIYKLTPDGQLDSSFANGVIHSVIGLSENDFGNMSVTIAVDDSGRIILIGKPKGGDGIAAIRLSATGQIDSSFGNGGAVAAESLLDGFPQNIEVLSDGSILINFVNNTQLGDFGGAGVVKLQPTGTLDTNFGDNGIARIPRPFSGNYQFGFANGFDEMVVDSSGRAIIGSDNAMARFTSNGNLDFSFGVDGIAAYPNTFLSFDSGFQVTTSGFSDLLIDSQDRLIAHAIVRGPGSGGSSGFPFVPGPILGSIVFRFDSNGNVERSIGDNGRELTTQMGGFEAALDSSDRLVSVGLLSNSDVRAIGRFTIG